MVTEPNYKCESALPSSQQHTPPFHTSSWHPFYRRQLKYPGRRRYRSHHHQQHHHHDDDDHHHHHDHHHQTMSVPAFATPLHLPLRTHRPSPSRHRSKGGRPRCSYPETQTRTTLSNPPLESLPSRHVRPERIVLRDITHENKMLAASHAPRSIPEMRAYIGLLRRQKLSLLLADLVSRVRCDHYPAPDKSLENLLIALDSRASHLLREGHDASLRADIRSLLWQLRLHLDPYNPSEWMKSSLEVARSAFLDIPDRAANHPSDHAVVRRDMYMLMTENILLEELRSLRFMERQLNLLVRKLYPAKALPHLASAANASGLLGIDDYRVRGKTRLADAVIAVRDELHALTPSLAPDVSTAIHVLHHALVKSLETDLSARRPLGTAMLLRPRMDDIPNFDVVSYNLLRGGQPNSRGLDWLSNYGVSVVVDLRGSDRENQWDIPKCSALPTQNNSGKDIMRLCYIPIEDFSTPTVGQVEEFINLADRIHAQGGVIFVHCKAGIGRTGTLIACWRIAKGEDTEVALGKERLYCDGGGGLRQEKFVREFALSRRNN